MATKPKMPAVGVSSPKKDMKDATMSAGSMRVGEYPGVKTSGIKIRGTGAATKGTKARGPMA